MNYRQIEIFVAVLEAGSVTAAAAALGLSQPAVSKSLRNLEESIGIPLFQRQSRGIVPTGEGRALYLEGRRMLEGFDRLEGFARDLPNLTQARLEIVCMPALSLGWLPEAIGDFLARHPQAALSARTFSSPETVEMVLRGEVDFGISQVRAEQGGLRKRRLLDMRLMAVVPLDHPLARKPVLGLADLDGQPLMVASHFDELYRLFAAAMQRHGHGFTSRVEVAVGVMLMRMVGPGTGIGLVDEYSARLHASARTVLRPIAPELSIPIYLVENVQRPQSLFARLCIEHLAGFAGQTGGYGQDPAESGANQN